MLTGENGILTQAQRAKNETENAQKEEESTLANYEQYINASESGNTVFTDDNGKIAIIPKGFYIVPGLDNVDNGLVISDVENDTQNTGNQFVWVPVPEFSEFKREHFGTEAQKGWGGEFVTDKISSPNLYEPAADGIANQTEVEKMYKSVKENKGFYIGRYETGKEGERAVSKKNVDVYNKIGWNGDGTMETETGGVVEKARNFDIESGHTNITSTLVYGVQWDAVMRWISKDNNLKGYLTDSSGIGNYSGILNEKTGANDTYQMKNIYDLAGNMNEWTMEASAGGRVGRGGFCTVSAKDYPCSYRIGIQTGYNTSANIGFRIAIYL